MLLSYRIKYGRPPFHGDTLEDCEHGKADVVEGGDPVVGPLPLLQADGHVLVAHVGAKRRRLERSGEAGAATFPFYHNFV